jgi:type III pantothenate kinase
MSVLLLDVGNTRLKWLRLGEHGSRRGAILHRDRPWEAVLDELLEEHEAPAAVALANVAGQTVEQTLAQWVGSHWPDALWYVARVQAQACGIVNAYREPAGLGIDRWLAMIGARAVVGLPACVIDCGSAVTIDAVDGAGRHRGGVIFPGLRLLNESLREGTGLRPQRDSDSEEFPPRDTVAAIDQGCLRGLAGAIEHLVVELSGELGDETRRVVTGGDAARLLPLLGSRFTLQEDLVLEGLELQMRECA